MFAALVAQIVSLTTTAAIVLQGALVVYSIVQARKQAKDARRAREASLRDRTVTVRSSNAPCFLVYGQTRVGGVLAAPPWTHGADKRYLSAVIVLAYHEVEEIVDVLFDNVSLGTLDAQGYVQAGSPYWWTRREVYSQRFDTAPASGDAVTLTYTPAKMESVAYETSENVTVSLQPGAGGYLLSGRFLQLQTDAAQGRPLTVTYQYSKPQGKVEVFNPYTGPVTLAHTPLRVVEVSYKRYIASDDQERTLDPSEYSVSGAVVTATGTLESGTNPSWTVVYEHEQAGIALVQVRKFLGIAAGQRDTDLEIASGGQWTANHLGKGVARIHVTMQFDQDFFPGSMPEISAIVKGKKVYDPRTTTTVYSANPALCIRDYQIDSLGWNMPSGDINDVVIEEEADVCDEMIDYAFEETHERYRLDGVVYCDAGLRENRDAMVTTIGGWAGMSNGKFVVRTAKARTSVKTLTDAHLAGGFETQVDVPFRDLFNSVRGQFINPAKGYLADDFPPYPPTLPHPYVTADGGRLWADFDFPFTQDVYRAQRLAKLRLYRARQPLSEAVTYNTAAMALQPLDTFAQTRELMGYDAKLFLVHSWKFNAATMQIQMTVQEDAPEVYAADYSEFVNPDPAPNTVLPDPRIVAAMDVTITSGVSTYKVLPDGSRDPYILIQWVPITASAVLRGGYVEILWKRSTNVEYDRIKVAPDETEYQLTGIRAGDAINFKIHAVNGLEVRSPAWIGFHIASQDLPTAGNPAKGGNLLKNAAFAFPMYGWAWDQGGGATVEARRPAEADRIDGAFRNVELYSTGTLNYVNGEWTSHRIPVQIGDRYAIFADMWTRGCTAAMVIRTWKQTSATVFSEVQYIDLVDPVTAAQSVGNAREIGNYVRRGMFLDIEAGLVLGSPTHMTIEFTRTGNETGADSTSAFITRPMVAWVAPEVSEYPEWAPGDASQPNFDVTEFGQTAIPVTTEYQLNYQDEITTLTLEGGGELFARIDAFIALTPASAHISRAELSIENYPAGAEYGAAVAILPSTATVGTAVQSMASFERSLGVWPVGTHSIKFRATSRRDVAGGASAPAGLTVTSYTASAKFKEPA